MNENRIAVGFEIYLIDQTQAGRVDVQAYVGVISLHAGFVDHCSSLLNVISCQTVNEKKGTW